MACLARCALGFFVFVLATAALAGFALWRASAWLGAADSPEKADAIQVLGAEPTRAITGASLYRDGYARIVYLSVPHREQRWVALEQDGIRWPWFEDAARLLLRNRGVPENAIRLLGKDLVSTVAEAVEAARALGPSTGTLLVVTSRYHVYRARLVFSEHLPGTRVLVVASAAEPLPERWWTDQEAARNVALELVKLAFYRAGLSFR
jgi:uncharacterized SAM-binding protein YcdF (DUF218 family)